MTSTRSLPFLLVALSEVAFDKVQEKYSMMIFVAECGLCNLAMVTSISLSVD